MSDTINVVRYELSLNDLLTGKLNEADDAANKLEGGLDTAKKKVGELGESGEKIEGLKEKLGGLAEGASKVAESFGIPIDLSSGIEYVKKATEEYEKLKLAQTQVEAVLKSTQNSAGLTFDELKKGASETADKLKFSTTEIMNMQAVLLKFPSVTKQNFSIISSAAEDISSSTGKDLNTVAKQLGQALENPSKNISALELGLSNSQEKLIKDLAEAGKTAEAQGLILKEVDREYGGNAAATAAADPFLKAANSIDDLQMNIGLLGSNIKEYLGPIIEVVFGGLNNVINYIITQFGSLGVTASGFGESVKKTWHDIINFIRPLFEPIERYVGIVLGSLKNIWVNLLQFKPQFEAIANWLRDAFAVVIQVAGTIYQKVYRFIAGIIDFYHTIYVVLEKLGIINLIGKIFESVWVVIKSIGENIKGLYQHILKPIFDKLEWAYDKLKKILGIKKIDVIVTGTTGKLTDTKPSPETPADQPPTQKTSAKPLSSPNSSSKETAGATGNKSTIINIKINELVKELNLHSTTIQGGAKQIKDIITEVLLSAVNDSQRVAYD